MAVTRDSDILMSLKNAIKPFDRGYYWLYARVEDGRIPSRQEATGHDHWVRPVDIQTYLATLPLSQSAKANHTKRAAKNGAA